MAAPTFVGAGAGVTIATGSGAATAAGSGVAVGDVVVLQVLQDGITAGAVALSAISGIAGLGGAAGALTPIAIPLGTNVGGFAKQFLWMGRATSTTCSVTVATTGDDLYYRLYVFRNVAAGTGGRSDLDFTASAGTESNLGSTSTNLRSAQQFTAPFTGTLDAIGSGLNRSGSPTDGVVVEIQTDSGGVPSGTVVGSSITVFPLQAYGSELVPVQAPITSGSKYWIVWRRVGAFNATDFYQLFAASPAYAGHNSALWTGSSWTTASTTRVFWFACGASEIMENGSGLLAADPGATTAVINDVAVTTTGADRLALQFVGVDDDNPLAAFTGETGGDWTEATAAFVTATGTDAAIQLQIATKASAGTIDGGSQTMAAADNWGVIGFALKPAGPVGPATVERSAALGGTGLVAAVGRKEAQRTTAVAAAGTVATAATFWTTFERQVAANATGLIATAGVRQAPATQRSAALNATGLIASVGRELLPRSAALTATGLVATSGVVIHVRSRQAALTATGLIATVGRELLPRTAALTATGLVSASGVKVGAAATVERTAALTATGLIASSGRELLPRLSRVDATGLISAVGQRRLHRQTVLGATATIAANGMIEGGAATVERSAALTATGSIATVRLRVHVRQAVLAGTGTVAVAYQRRHQRAALVAATGTVTVGFSRSWSSAATLSATGTVSATPRRLLLRATSLQAVGLIELTAGGPTAQFSFEAVGTITVVVPWYAGAISTPTTGYIYGAYLGAIQGGTNGRIATGTDGQLAKTGG